MSLSKTYTISELAQEFGITTRTIRYYEDEALLSPRREGQQRIYAEKDRVLLKLILRGKRLGFSLNESKGILALYEPGGSNQHQLQTMLNLLREKQESLRRRLEDIEMMQSDLLEAEARISRALIDGQANGDADSHKQI